VRHADGVDGQVGDDRCRSIRGNLDVDGCNRCAHSTATVVATPDGFSAQRFGEPPLSPRFSMLKIVWGSFGSVPGAGIFGLG
jgi:hypothetical protein